MCVPFSIGAMIVGRREEEGMTVGMIEGTTAEGTTEDTTG
jgi:hypothetical protein